MAIKKNHSSHNIPALRFPGFEGEWEKKKLGELLEFKNGVNATKEQFGSGIKFINVLDILNNDFITYDAIVGSVNIDQSTLDKYSVEYGDVLFQRSSETREEVGTANVYLDENLKATFGGFVIRGKKISEYEPVFLNRILKTDLVREQITSKSGGSTRYNVGQDILASVILPLPSLPEQQKIASFFTAIDKKITQLKQQKEKLDLYKKGVMQQIFSGQLRFKTDDGNDFPEWERKKLGEVYSFISTNSFSREMLNYEKGEVKNIHYGDIHTKFKAGFDIQKEKVPFINSEIKKTKFDENFYCKEGDLILADASEDYADVGKAIEIINTANEKIVAGLHTIHARPDAGLIAVGFGAFLMKAEYVRLLIKKEAQGSKVLSISPTRLAQIELQIPCKEEQTKIANFLSAIDEKINKVQAQIQQTVQWKKGLLQRMFV